MSVKQEAYVELEKAVADAISQADQNLEHKYWKLYDLTGIERNFIFGPKPKVQIEMELKMYDKSSKSWQLMKKSKPIWIKNENDIQNKLLPILEEFTLCVAEIDFIHLHCKDQ